MWWKMPKKSNDSCTFGRLTFIRKSEYARRSVYQCSCGKEFTAFTFNVKSGKTSSCGCLARELTASRSTIHGHAVRGNHSREYETWSAMIARCTKTYRLDYPRYGGRGTSVCRRWLEFENFLLDMGKRPEGKSIDRINNNGNYEPSNCKWSTPKEQANNRRPRRKSLVNTDPHYADTIISIINGHGLKQFDVPPAA